ncbi:class I SAM-dependent methyltransferase [Croceicoccus bisphenolivorans]|uniref:class I SAM-dependent methyltransferase n=1 Tax=Croceicoccus bisphenolivorans TaxID=1783232 RepID=UPI000829A33A|nr:methyltransferase domain-containing protein [Croceicoccus bisphenolivorans]
MAAPSGPPVNPDHAVKLAIEQAIISEKLCELLAIPAGARVLDIGTAMGHSALYASIAAGRRRARVTAVHTRPHVLERARQRARVEALDDIEFMEADATALPFDDGQFDYVLSTLGINFLPDQEAAAGVLARMVRPGGVIGLIAFSRHSLPSRVYDMFGTLLPHIPRPPHHHYEWADGPRAGALLSPAFHDVKVMLDSYDSCFASTEEAFDRTSRWNPNMEALIERSPPELVAKVREGYIDIARSINQATDGTFMGRIPYGIVTAVRNF